MLVREVMVSPVVSIPADASLKKAVKRMLDAGVGSAIVTTNGKPGAIVTETDAMIAGCVTDRPFADLQVGRVASSPLKTVGPAATLRTAVERMRTNDVKKLPVVDGIDLVGIVTMTDVVENYAAIVREAHEQDRQREDWERAGSVDVGVEDPTADLADRGG